MRFAIGKFPALASHTLVFITGMAVSRSWQQPAKSIRVRGPGPGQALISLPLSLSHKGQWKSLEKGTALSLVKVSRKTGKPLCMCSEILLKQADSQKRWRILVSTRDIREMYRHLDKPGRSVLIGPASSYRLLNLCTPSREVIYGSF